VQPREKPGVTHIGRRLRELREQRNLSRDDIERITGMRREYISRVEQEQIIPSLESIQRFAGAFDLPLHEVFRGISTQEPVPAPGDATLHLLWSYLRNMQPSDREVLMRVAQRLSKPG
jgi:transcriptional regulator with XRE-family HTH domain